MKCLSDNMDLVASIISNLSPGDFVRVSREKGWSGITRVEVLYNGRGSYKRIAYLERFYPFYEEALKLLVDHLNKIGQEV